MKMLAFSGSVFALTIGLTTFSSTVPAKADANAAFCLYLSGRTDARECNYYTLAQCQAAASGGGGSCTANPVAASARQRDRATR
ncbi:DUF3551 domain-containing protein [Bradyrhizobium sp.]|uniref:DUF3551 domain-containing protein n=1 Tax=Bradyrhizobium sp. TaxID=376 RepID=UPI0025BD5181|nr:DUF3551 domain-containing protein [Bradyrhizobium sp.]